MAHLFYYTPYIILPLFSSAVCAGLTIFAWRKRRAPVALPIFWIMLTLSVWSLSYALNTAALSLDLKVFFYKTAVILLPFIGVPVLSMALQLLGYGDWLTRRRLVMLSAFPLVTVLLAWTGESHTLSRHSFYLLQSGPLLALGFKTGAAWILYLLYSNGLNLAATVLFAIGLKRNPAGLRARFLLLIIGTLVPMLVEGLNLTPVKGFRMTTSCLWFTGCCYTLAIFRHRLMEVAPVARATLFDQLSEPVLVFDREDNLVDCNRAAQVLFGPASGAGFASLRASAFTRFPVLKALLNGAPIALDDFVEDGIDDKRHWKIKSLPLSGGKVRVGHLVQLYDVSVLKQREEELRQAHYAAEAANRAKSVFLANMSHEIRTPMTAIMGFTDLVLDTSLTTEQRKYLETVKQSSDALLAILNEVMDFSKIEAGKMRLEEVDFDLSWLIRSSVNTLSLQAEKKGLKLEHHISPDVPAIVSGDPVRLKQVLLNLAGNAIKFTEKGEIRITVQTVKSAGDDASGTLSPLPYIDLLFRVRDTGTGIPKEKLESVFSSFTQADNSITRKYGGTGLGLTISRKLVRVMGGELKVESTEGEGSTFYFTARFSPGSPPGATIPADDTTLHHPARKRLRILVVEDMAINRTLAVRLLEKRGHLVASVENGKDAVRLLEKEIFDVVLMDVQMPVMDGCEAAGIIRDAHSPVRRHDVPIIALTAHAFAGDKDRCLATGMNGYITKPLKSNELIAAVEQYDEEISSPPPVPPMVRSILPYSNDCGISTPETQNVAGGTDISAEADPVEKSRAELLKRYSGDGALVEELLRVFRDEIPNLICQVGDAIEAQDVARLEMHAHACGSAAGAAGFNDVREIARDIESAAKAGDIKGTRVLYIKMETELLKFLHCRQGAGDSVE